MLYVLRRLRSIVFALACAVALGLATNAAAAETEQGGTPFPMSEWSRLAIVLAIALVMAILFFVVFLWQRRIEQAGYFACIYQDSISTIEYARLAAPYLERWQRAEYQNEIFLERSDRGRDWVVAHRKPGPCDELLKVASALDRQEAGTLGRQETVEDLRRSMDVPRPSRDGEAFSSVRPMSRRPGSSVGGLGGSRWSAGSGIGKDEDEIKDELLRHVEIASQRRSNGTTSS